MTTPKHPDQARKPSERICELHMKRFGFNALDDERFRAQVHHSILSYMDETVPGLHARLAKLEAARHPDPTGETLIGPGARNAGLVCAHGVTAPQPCTKCRNPQLDPSPRSDGDAVEQLRTPRDPEHVVCRTRERIDSEVLAFNCERADKAEQALAAEKRAHAETKAKAAENESVWSEQNKDTLRGRIESAQDYRKQIAERDTTISDLRAQLEASEVTVRGQDETISDLREKLKRAEEERQNVSVNVADAKDKDWLLSVSLACGRNFGEKDAAMLHITSERQRREEAELAAKENAQRAVDAINDARSLRAKCEEQEAQTERAELAERIAKAERDHAIRERDEARTELRAAIEGRLVRTRIGDIVRNMLDAFEAGAPLPEPILETGLTGKMHAALTELLQAHQDRDDTAREPERVCKVAEEQRKRIDEAVRLINEWNDDGDKQDGEGSLDVRQLDEALATLTASEPKTEAGGEK